MIRYLLGLAIVACVGWLIRRTVRTSRAARHPRIDPKRFLAVSLALLLAAPSCAGYTHPAVPGLSLEGQLAVRGRQLIAAADSVVSGVDVLVTTNLLTRREAIDVLLHVRQVGTYATSMADWLRVIDTAKTAAERLQGIEQAKALARLIQQESTASLVPIGSVDARAKVAALVQAVTVALVDVLTAFPQTHARLMLAQEIGACL